MNDPFRSADSEDLDDLLGATTESEDLQDLLRTTTESQDLSELLAPSFSMSESRLQQQQLQQQQQNSQQPRTVPEETMGGGEDDGDDEDDGFLSASLADFVRQVESTLEVSHEGFLQTTTLATATTGEVDLLAPLPPLPVTGRKAAPRTGNTNGEHHDDDEEGYDHEDYDTTPMLVDEVDVQQPQDLLISSPAATVGLSEEEEALRRAELAVLKRYHMNHGNNASSSYQEEDTQEDMEIQFGPDVLFSPDLATPPPNPHYKLSGLTEAKRLAMQGQEEELQQPGAASSSGVFMAVATPLASETAAAGKAKADAVVADNNKIAEAPLLSSCAVEVGALIQREQVPPPAPVVKGSIDDVPKSQPHPTNVTAAAATMISPAGSSFPDTLAFRRSQMGGESSVEGQSSSAVARKQSKPPLTVDTNSAVLDGTGPSPSTTLTPPHSSMAREPRSGSSSGSVVSEVSYVGEVDEAMYDEEAKRKTPRDAPAASFSTAPAPASEKAYSPHPVETSTTTALSPTQGFSKRQPSPALAAARAAARGAVTTLKNSVTGMVPKKVASVAPAPPPPTPSPPQPKAKVMTKPAPKPAPVQPLKRSPPKPASPKRSPTAPVVSANSRLLQGTAASASHLKNGHEQHADPQTSPRTRTRERLRQRLQKQKEKPPAEKAKSNFSSEDGIQRARERIRLRHEELQKAEKENELRKSRAAAAARVKSSRPVTKPQGPRLSTSARFPDRKPLPGSVAKTMVRRELTVPQSPKFASNERHGVKKLGNVMDRSTTMANSTDILRKGLRSDGRSVESNGSRGPTIPHSPKFATTERHGRKAVNMNSVPPLALSSDILSKGLRENKPGPTSSQKRELTLTVPCSPKFSYVKKREAPKSKAEEEKEVMDYYMAHPFKAQPVMMNATSKPTGTQKPPRVITVPAPFHLRTDDRAILHKHTDESEASENSAKPTRQFQARPMPNFSRSGLNPLASTVPHRKPPTNPRPFRLSTGTRAIESKRSSSPEPSKPKPFVARPLPKTTYTPSPTKISSSVSSMEKYSHITPPHLETAVRSEIRQVANEAFNMHAEEFIKKKEIQAKIRQREKQIEEMVKSDAKSADARFNSLLGKDDPSADLHEQLKGIDSDHARMTQFRARPYQASPPPTMKPRSARKPTTPEPFQLSRSVSKHHAHEEEERIRAEQEAEELQKKANFKARPVPQTTYKYNPISPNATGVPFHIANENRRMAEEEKRKADEELRKFKARPVPMTTYTPKPILSPTSRPPPSEVTIPQPIFSPELALKQRAHESMAMDAYAAEQERLQAETPGRENE